MGLALDSIGDRPRAYVIDFSAVSVLDSTAAATLEGFARKAQRRGAVVYLAAARSTIRRVLLSHGVRPPLVRYRTSLVEAVAAAQRKNASTRAVSAAEASSSVV